MDGLSAAASVTAVVQISGQVFGLCWEYYSKVKDARENIKRLRDELKFLEDVVTNVEDLVDAPGSAKLSILGLLNQPDGPVQQCLKVLTQLAEKLKPEKGMDMRKFGSRALQWPFISKDVDNVIAVIGRNKTTLSLALAGDQTYVEQFFPSLV